jgi:hypothetical protein
MGGKGRLIIIDDAYAELEYINRQIILWKTKVSALDKSRHLFYCPSIAGMTRKLEGFITTSTQFQSGDRQLFLSSCQLEQKRSTEWTKVEAESAKNLAELFGLSRNVSYAKEKNMHCTAMFHILSEKIFRNEADASYYVYQLGSIHNMHGIVSTESTLPVAISNGTSEFHLEVQMLSPLSIAEYYNKVVINNVARSVFMLAPKYFFNSQLNMLRKLPGKTIDFTTGELEDDGIDVSSEPWFQDEETYDDTEDSEGEEQEEDETNGPYEEEEGSLAGGNISDQEKQVKKGNSSSSSYAPQQTVGEVAKLADAW